MPYYEKHRVTEKSEYSVALALVVSSSLDWEPSRPKTPQPRLAQQAETREGLMVSAE